MFKLLLAVFCALLLMTLSAAAQDNFLMEKINAAV
jgi:hypothetical protein